MILGNGLRLRAMEKDDLPRFVAWLNDPEVSQGLLLTTPLSLAQEEKWFGMVLQGPPPEQPLVIEAWLDDNWVPIGNISFKVIDWHVRKAEIGIFIGEKQHWSHGYGREAMQLMVKHGFETLNLNRVYLHVHENNRRAIRSYEHAGFVHEGRLRQDHFQDGNYIDVLIMSILHSEWPGSQSE